MAKLSEKQELFAHTEGVFEMSEPKVERHDSDCSTNNRGVPDLLGPCDCSLSKRKQACTDERPCVNCFSGNGSCLAKEEE